MNVFESPAPGHLASAPVIGHNSGVSDAQRVAQSELRQFVERVECVRAEKKALTDAEREILAEAKARGYDTKALRRVIQLRALDPEELAEFESVVSLYRESLGG